MSLGFKHKILIDFKARNVHLKMMGFGIHQNIIQLSFPNVLFFFAMN